MKTLLKLFLGEWEKDEPFALDLAALIDETAAAAAGEGEA